MFFFSNTIDLTDHYIRKSFKFFAHYFDMHCMAYNLQVLWHDCVLTVHFHSITETKWYCFKCPRDANYKTNRTRQIYKLDLAIVELKKHNHLVSATPSITFWQNKKKRYKGWNRERTHSYRILQTHAPYVVRLETIMKQMPHRGWLADFRLKCWQEKQLRPSSIICTESDRNAWTSLVVGQYMGEMCIYVYEEVPMLALNMSSIVSRSHGKLDSPLDSKLILNYTIWCFGLTYITNSWMI